MAKTWSVIRKGEPIPEDVMWLERGDPTGVRITAAVDLVVERDPDASHPVTLYGLQPGPTVHVEADDDRGRAFTGAPTLHLLHGAWQIGPPLGLADQFGAPAMFHDRIFPSDPSGAYTPATTERGG